MDISKYRFIEVGKILLKNKDFPRSEGFPVLVYSLDDDPNGWIYAECLPLGQVGTGRDREESIEDLKEILTWYLNEIKSHTVDIVPSAPDLWHFYMNSKTYFESLFSGGGLEAEIVSGGSRSLEYQTA